MMRYKILLPLGICFALVSCKFGPNYERPEVANMPPVFRGASSSAPDSIANLPWWKVYQNKDLQSLIRTALKNNHDLGAAVARVQQAREQIIMTRSPIFPLVGYSNDLSRGKNSVSGNPANNNGQTINSEFSLVSVSWELDLWGKIRRQTESATAQYLATEQGKRALMLSIVSQVATAYFQLISLDMQLTLSQETVDSFQKSLTLFQNQLDKGVGDILQVSSAEALLASAAAEIPKIEAQIVQQENLINLLCGKAPGKVKRSGSLADAGLGGVHVPSGLPAALLNQRPDIRQAEEQLRAANAEIGVAIANYFPSISLTGGLGKISNSLSSSFWKGKSNHWSITGDATGPIFQAGALTANERASRQGFLAAKHNYEQTVLSALKEVSDVLVLRSKLSDVRTQQERSVKAYETSVVASTDRYVQGLANYYEILNAQQFLFPQQIALIQTRYQYTVTLVNLYSALGGGWNLDDPEFVEGLKSKK